MHRLTRWFRRPSTPRRPAPSPRSFLPGLEGLGGAFSPAPAARPRPVRPEVEILEQRNLPSSSGSLSAIQDNFGNHVVYSIGADHAVWENVNSSGWFSQGGYVIDLSAGLDAGGHAEVFAIGSDHSPWLRDGAGWHALGGYVIDLSGSWNNEVYAIAGDHTPWVHNAQTGWHNLGGYVLQLSAGLDYVGQDEVWAIAGDHSVWLNDANGWHCLGGWAAQLSATLTNSVYAIGSDHSVWWTNLSSGWYGLGGYALQIASGVESGDHMDEVFAIGANHDLECRDDTGWRGLGGYVTNISGTAQDDMVYATALDHSVWLNQANGWHNNYWYDLGGYAQ